MNNYKIESIGDIKRFIEKRSVQFPIKNKKLDSGLDNIDNFKLQLKTLKQQGVQTSLVYFINVVEKETEGYHWTMEVIPVYKNGSSLVLANTYVVKTAEDIQ